MLIITRRPGETVVIGENEIRVTVLSSEGASVRLGISAPNHIRILREELFVRDRMAG